MNCSLINHNNPVLRALPFIQATAEVILHNYSKFPVFERGLWKRPVISRLPEMCHSEAVWLQFSAVKDTGNQGRC